MQKFVLEHTTIDGEEITHEVKNLELLIDKIDEVTHAKNFNGNKVYLFMKGDFVYVSKSPLNIQFLLKTKHMCFNVGSIKSELKEYTSFDDAYKEALKYSNELK